MRYFLTLSYRGAPYCGWQRQPCATPSVQGAVEDALATVTRLPQVPVTGAGRTDAGVNARLMVAHLDLPDRTSTPVDDLCRRANTILGPDIVLHDLTPVRPDAHARFDATARTYRYRILLRRSPFLYPLAWFPGRPLDFAAMAQAAQCLVGRHDFTSFAKLHSDARTNICTVTEARFEVISPGHEVQLVITADRFLRNMVRAVMGTLAEVGRGRVSPQGVMEIMERRDRCAAGTSMPAHALYLWDIRYPHFHALRP